MPTDGSFNPAGTYVPQNKDSVDLPLSHNHDVAFGAPRAGGPAHMSKLPVFGTPTADGKFTSVSIDGQVVYTEDHPTRFPQT
jgi:hypothetical protein